TPLTVTRTDVESPKGKSLGTVKTDAKGAFTFTDTPPVGGKVTYRVAYAGSATHTAASGSAAVTVSRAAVSLKLNRNKSLHAYNKNVSFTATLGKTYKNRVVELWAD
ncbi:Ig-like domain repeat protein, partial [Streptomyces sp. SID8455]|nr:Ig-like domain repeat protein [Streptomyces sp. SID8455]